MAFDFTKDRIAVGMLVVLSVMLGAMLIGGTAGQIIFSYTIICFFGLYILNGTQSTTLKQSGNRPFLKLVIGLVGILGVAFAALWYFHFQNPAYTDPTYWLGFPRATAVVVYALWMPPALYLMFSYPYLFEKYIWSESQANTFKEMDRSPSPTTVTGDDD